MASIGSFLSVSGLARGLRQYLLPAARTLLYIGIVSLRSTAVVPVVGRGCGRRWLLDIDRRAVSLHHHMWIVWVCRQRMPWTPIRTDDYSKMRIKTRFKVSVIVSMAVSVSMIIICPCATEPCHAQQDDYEYQFDRFHKGSSLNLIGFQFAFPMSTLDAIGVDKLLQDQSRL